MIRQILDKAIAEVEKECIYEITQFELGIEPMVLFNNECRDIMGIDKSSYIEVDNYRQIPVKKHPSTDAVMFALRLK